MDERAGAVEIRVPELPESVTEATVAAWNKGVGDRVRRDENVVEIETDKVVFEVPAPRDGMLQQVYKQAGEDVTSGETLATLIPGEAPAAQPPESVATAPAEERAEVTTGARAPLGPAVQRLIEEHELDPARIPASGKGGRLTKADVLAYLEQRQAPRAASGQGAERPAEFRRRRPPSASRSRACGACP